MTQNTHKDKNDFIENKGITAGLCFQYTVKKSVMAHFCLYYHHCHCHDNNNNNNNNHHCHHPLQYYAYSDQLQTMHSIPHNLKEVLPNLFPFGWHFRIFTGILSTCSLQFILYCSMDSIYCDICNSATLLRSHTAVITAYWYSWQVSVWNCAIWRTKVSR